MPEAMYIAELTSTLALQFCAQPRELRYWPCVRSVGLIAAKEHVFNPRKDTLHKPFTFLVNHKAFVRELEPFLGKVPSNHQAGKGKKIGLEAETVQQPSGMGAGGNGKKNTILPTVVYGVHHGTF